MNCYCYKKGFSLIEVIVSIGIIALLVGILVPALGNARDQSRELVSAANLRSIGQIFDLYIENNRGLYPAPVPGEVYPDPNPHLGSVSMGHWQTSTFWPNLFYKDYPWAENRSLFLAPGAERDLELRPLTIAVIPSSFVYSASFLGKPRIWSGVDIQEDEWDSLIGSVKRSAVKYPSGKVLMWDREMPYLRRRLERDQYFNLLENTPMLFADQHVQSHIPANASQAMFNAAKFAAYSVHKLHNTKDGVYGRDY